MSSTPKTIVVQGAGTALGAPVAAALLARGATVALHEPGPAAELPVQLAGHNLPGVLLDISSVEPGDPAAPFQRLQALGHAVDAVINLFLPDADTDEAALRGYCDRLRPKLQAAIEHMRETGSKGIVVNQFLMPTLFAGQPIAEAMIEARNGVTALTRHSCLRGGREGVRAVGVMVGLLELPSLRALSTAAVNAAKTPLGRWIRPEEVAATLAFLTLDSGYMSGQTLVLDGGMTAGINGV